MKYLGQSRYGGVLEMLDVENNACKMRFYYCSKGCVLETASRTWPRWRTQSGWALRASGAAEDVGIPALICP
jgi:hypothetical protein